MLQESKLASWSMATTLEFLLQQVLDTEKLTTPVNPTIRDHKCIGTQLNVRPTRREFLKIQVGLTLSIKPQ